MIQRLLLLVLLFLASASLAQQPGPVFVPSLHAVTGVASDDTLNIRGAPSASAPILGELAPNATMIEVTALSEDGRWGRIGLGEGDGWVSMRYLREIPFPQGDIPDGMLCLGTEPFWSVAFQSGALDYSTPEGKWPSLPVVAAATRIPPGNQLFGFDATIRGRSLSGMIEAGRCSDGMSDRSYGWRVVLMRQEAGMISLESGCCTLDPR